MVVGHGDGDLYVDRLCLAPGAYIQYIEMFTYMRKSTNDIHRA